VRLLLDANIVVPLVDGCGRDLPAYIRTAIAHEDADLVVSVASIWEVAIKHRLGKLPLPCPLPDWPAALASLNIRAIPVRTAHVIQLVEPPPQTRDPFDRLMLAICAAEKMRLVTLDKKLIDHPLAWRPQPA
jgi:PIN domain nuclease of toxin-antitoxin system